MGFRDTATDLKDQLHLLLRELAEPLVRQQHFEGMVSPESPSELGTCGLYLLSLLALRSLRSVGR